VNAPMNAAPDRREFHVLAEQSRVIGKLHGNPNISKISRLQTSELLASHSNDLERFSAQRNLSAQSGRGRTKAALPEWIRENRDQVSIIRRVIVGLNQSADGWLDTQDLEAVSANRLGTHHFGRTAGVVDDRRLKLSVGRHEQVGRIVDRIAQA